MRAAVLHFGFRVLGAELAVTGAFPSNKGSIRVSEKIGYLQNGVRRDRVRGRPGRLHCSSGFRATSGRARAPCPSRSKASKAASACFGLDVAARSGLA